MTESRRRLRKNPNINPAAVDIPIGVHGFSFTYACVAGVACLALLPASVRAQTSCAFASSSLRSNRPRSAVKPSPENRSRDPAHDGRHAGSAEQDHSDACDPYQQVGRFVAMDRYGNGPLRNQNALCGSEHTTEDICSILCAMS